VLQDQWARAQPKFQYIWERRPQCIDGESKQTIRLKSGHYLAICLLKQNSYRAAVAVLTELYHCRALALGDDADETNLTLQQLETAKKALALDTKPDEKAGAEIVWMEGRRQAKKQYRRDDG
jgi:hypothetical protein